MVKKLLKYEFISYLRTLMPMYVIMLAIGLLNRFIQLFENDHFSYNIVFTSSLVALIISAVVCLLMTVVMGVIRFYKNLYTAEGYLSFTLPVTAGQHIFSKLMMLVTFTCISLLAIFAACSFAMMGEFFAEVFKAIGYLLNRFCREYSTHSIFYILEVILLFFAAIIYLYLVYYGCITIGQTAKKNRILMAFGVYFIYYLITQVLGTIMVIVGMFFGEIGILEKLGTFITRHPLTSAHFFLIGEAVLLAGLSAAYYFIIRYFMNNKLNLE